MPAHKKKRETRTCPHCKKEFDALKNSPRRWCSRACYHPTGVLNGRYGKHGVPWNKGTKYSEEFKKTHRFGAPKGTPSNRGTKWTMESRIRKSMERAPRERFDGFVTTERRKERLKYVNFVFRKSVLQRDQYTCVNCGAIEGLHVHHIKSWRAHPELRAVVENGETLCGPCHRRVHYNKAIGETVYKD